MGGAGLPRQARGLTDRLPLPYNPSTGDLLSDASDQPPELAGKHGAHPGLAAPPPTPDLLSPRRLSLNSHTRKSPNIGFLPGSGQAVCRGLPGTDSGPWDQAPTVQVTILVFRSDSWAPITSREASRVSFPARRR